MLLLILFVEQSAEELLKILLLGQKRDVYPEKVLKLMLGDILRLWVAY